MTASPRLPSFVVIGSPKAGTSSLHEYVRQHPDIYVPSHGELHYFTRDQLARCVGGPGDKAKLQTICKTRRDYEQYFADARAETAVGEFSPSYLYFSEVAERIREELGEVKIIALLRNPVERAHSQYHHLRLGGREHLSFADALDAEEERRHAGWGDFWRYAESGLLSKRLAHYFEVFGRPNVKVIFFQDFNADTQGTLAEVFRFLGVDPSFRPDVSRVYAQTGTPRSLLLARLIESIPTSRVVAAARKVVPPPVRHLIVDTLRSANRGEKEEMDEATRERLAAYFRDDVAALEALLGRPTGWKLE